MTRGYGQDRELFEFFPSDARWVRALLAPKELASVRYLEDSYWNAISGGTRLASDAARRITAGVRAFGVSNDWFFAAAAAVARGERFPPLIVAGVAQGELVCLEGNLRLTGHALWGSSAVRALRLIERDLQVLAASGHLLAVGRTPI